MPTSDTELKRLAHSEYWDERYSKVGPDEQVHEWFRSFNDLAPFFDRHLFQVRGPETGPEILHLGSGDSTIPEELSRKGYKNQVCVDFSPVVVETMSKRHKDIGGITWKHADVREMDQIPSESVDVAFDKGTLDAMIYGSPWDPPDEVLDNTSRYVREVFRTLKSDGTFIYVTYRQPHFIKPLLNCEGAKWDVEVDVLASSESSLEYHGFVLKKDVSSATESAEAEAPESRLESTNQTLSAEEAESQNNEFWVEKVYVARSTMKPPTYESLHYHYAAMMTTPDIAKIA